MAKDNCLPTVHNVSDRLDSISDYEVLLAALNASGLKGKMINLGIRGPPFMDQTLGPEGLSRQTWKAIVQAGCFNGLEIHDLAKHGEDENGDDTISTEWFRGLIKSATHIEALTIHGWHKDKIHSPTLGPISLMLTRAFSTTYYPHLTCLNLKLTVIERPRLAIFIKKQRHTLRSIELQQIYIICGSFKKVVQALCTVANLEHLFLDFVVQKMEEVSTGPATTHTLPSVYVDSKENVDRFLQEANAFFWIRPRPPPSIHDGYCCLEFPIILQASSSTCIPGMGLLGCC